MTKSAWKNTFGLIVLRNRIIQRANVSDKQELGDNEERVLSGQCFVTTWLLVTAPRASER